LPDESEVATAAQVEVVEETELTVEKEMVDALTSDIAPLEFEAFTTQELTEERYAPAPTQEHVGLAEAIAAAESREIEAEAMSAPLDGVDTGVLGVDEIAEDETFFLDDPDDDRDLDHDPDEESVEVDEDSPGAGGSELTLRIASAVLLVSVFGLSLSLGGVAFLVFIGAVSLVALTEFMDVSTESGYRPLRLFAWLGAIGILVGTYTNGPAAIPAGLAATAAVVLAWFGSRSEPPQEPYVSSVVTLFGVAWIPALLSFVLPIAESPNRIALVVSLMLIVAAFDVGSYFVGRALGKRKLAPEISPNKSVEGLIGGVVLALIVALVASVFVEPITALIAVYLAIGISIAAPLGDLSESLVKRHFGVKDMGDILPGHGGLLDRIDGYLFAVPVAYLILLWTGVI
jgi:phosphatidate cytidylyltransferase